MFILAFKFVSLLEPPGRLGPHTYHTRQRRNDYKPRHFSGISGKNRKGHPGNGWPLRLEECNCASGNSRGAGLLTYSPISALTALKQATA